MYLQLFKLNIPTLKNFWIYLYNQPCLKGHYLPKSDIIDALIKGVSVTYKCYEMYVHRGGKGATARALRSIKKWMPSY